MINNSLKLNLLTINNMFAKLDVERFLITS